jgi:pseudaminic acid synthase
MQQTISINGRQIGAGHPAFIIAEISGNHNGDLPRAKRLVRIAAEAGADAVKLQTYTADSMTLDSERPEFVIGPGTVWEGRRLYDLYAEAATPYEWYSELAVVAAETNITLFSTPFDLEAVRFLDSHNAPAYKIASFELCDLAIVVAAASTGRPLIISTGMATLTEIEQAVAAAEAAGDGGVAVLRCNSAYPASPAEMDLRTIEDLLNRFGLPVGLSDHSLTNTAAVASVALGASIFEKHFMERRSDGGPDSSFSLEPAEFARFVDEIRTAESALGQVRYGPSKSEEPSLKFRRSLWVVEDVAAGEPFTSENVRSIRPAGGLSPALIDQVFGATAQVDVKRGTPVTTDLIAVSGTEMGHSAGV